MGTGKALLGVMAGIAAGAIIGILFAPDKGTYTRKKIVRKGEDLMDELNDKMEKKFDDLEQRFEDSLKNATNKFFRVKSEKDRKAEMTEN
jgi:gas vesicle protein